MKQIEQLINTIFKFTSGLLFWEIHNTVGQSWIFPQRRAKRFLSLFQPSSTKGKIVAAVLPYLRFMPFLASRINARAVKVTLNPVIKKTICKSFGITDFEYGVFCGSPGRHQKITLMINQGRNCLGYCKITDNPEVFSIFRNESGDLSYLKSKGIQSVPDVLFVDGIDELPGFYLFVQTTKRNGVVRTAAIDDGCVFDFVSQMHELTQNRMSYAESDFAQSVNVLKNYIHLFKTDAQKDILHAVVEVEKMLVEPCSYSASHGDFTPWNCYVINEKLFVFDFEYFQKYTIPYIDYFHFFTQSCIYNEYMEADAIWKKYMENREMIQNRIDNADFYYTCYLLNIMAFYLKRDDGFLNERIESCFNTWIELLKKTAYGFSA